MKRATRIPTRYRVHLLTGIAALVLSGPAYAWGGYDAPPAPAPTPPAQTITNSPMGGSGGQGGHARATATATAGSARATGGTASATSSPSQRVVVRVSPAAAPAPAATPTATDPSGARHGADPAGDPSGVRHGGRGGGNGGGIVAPPSFALPSFDAGQCSTVGFGIAISPSGGGAFGPAWESTNCRNYYIALALIKLGRVDQGVQLLSMITPEAKRVLAAAPVQPVTPPVSEPTEPQRPDYCTRGGWTAAETAKRYPECR
jgi:hypothetical protein